MRARCIFLFLALLLPACKSDTADMALIPAGEFTLGIDPAKELPDFATDRTASMNAQPLQKHRAAAFYLDKFEVTYGQFLQFKPRPQFNEGTPEEPMRGVSWYEADAYCLWRGKRLPTEFEWEKAARGHDERLFTWGSEFNKDYANFGKKALPAGSVPQDVSPYGIYDMNGNVSEWTASPYLPYPNSTYRDENTGKNLRVIRGGSFYKRDHGFMKEFAMITHRNFAPPSTRALDTGFRCAKDASKN